MWSKFGPFSRPKKPLQTFAKLHGMAYMPWTVLLTVCCVRGFRDRARLPGESCWPKIGQSRNSLPYERWGCWHTEHGDKGHKSTGSCHQHQTLTNCLWCHEVIAFGLGPLGPRLMGLSAQFLTYPRTEPALHSKNERKQKNLWKSHKFVGTYLYFRRWWLFFLSLMTL